VAVNGWLSEFRIVWLGVVAIANFKTFFWMVGLLRNSDIANFALIRHCAPFDETHHNGDLA